MEIERKVFFLKKALGPIRDDRSYKGELLFTCPRCSHHKNKLCVNIETDQFHCWHCKFGDRSSIERLLRYCDDKNIVDEYVGTKSKFKKPEKQTVKPVLPNEFISLSDRSVTSLYASHARTFLKRRGISEEQIDLYKIGYAEEGRFKFRIIIPSFDANGELNFFVGRAIYDADMKYLHGLFDKNIIFNDLMVDWTQSVIVTEGPFDAIHAGTNAIPLQGTFMSMNSAIFAKIVKKRTDIYLALDSDARAHRMKTASMLISYGIRCFDVPLGDFKDLGEMNSEQITAAISAAKSMSDRVSLMRAKVFS